MKVSIKKDIDSGTAVEIHCREITSETERLERYIQRFDERIMATANGQTHTIALEQILYIESVDKKDDYYQKEETEVMERTKTGGRRA